MWRVWAINVAVAVLFASSVMIAHYVTVPDHRTELRDSPSDVDDQVLPEPSGLKSDPEDVLDQ